MEAFSVSVFNMRTMLYNLCPSNIRHCTVFVIIDPAEILNARSSTRDEQTQIVCMNEICIGFSLNLRDLS